MNDDEMDRLLRRGDPAAGLQPLAAARVQQLTDRARAASPAGPAPARSGDGTGRRRRRRIATAATGLLGSGVAAAIAVPMLLAPAAGVTVLRVTPAVSGLATACAPVTAAALIGADLAVRAEVTSIDDGTVSLRVLDRYVGVSADTITVPQGEGEAIDGAAPVFDRGRDYLISASDGTVLSCGRTGADGPALRAVYDRAFPG